jgi:hypothetical protein
VRIQFHVSAYLTPEEHLRISKLARKAHLTVSDYIRTKLDLPRHDRTKAIKE